MRCGAVRCGVVRCGARGCTARRSQCAVSERLTPVSAAQLCRRCTQSATSTALLVSSGSVTALHGRASTSLRRSSCSPTARTRSSAHAPCVVTVLPTLGWSQWTDRRQQPTSPSFLRAVPTVIAASCGQLRLDCAVTAAALLFVSESRRGAALRCAAVGGQWRIDRS